MRSIAGSTASTQGPPGEGSSRLFGERSRTPRLKGEMSEKSPLRFLQDFARRAALRIVLRRGARPLEGKNAGVVTVSRSARARARGRRNNNPTLYYMVPDPKKPEERAEPADTGEPPRTVSVRNGCRPAYPSCPHAARGTASHPASGTSGSAPCTTAPARPSAATPASAF